MTVQEYLHSVCHSYNPGFLEAVRYTDSRKYSWWSYILHTYRQHIEVVYILEGNGVVYHHFRQYPVSAGDLVVKVPGECYSEYPCEGSYIEKVSFLLAPGEAPVCEGASEGFDESSPVIETRRCASLMKELCLYLAACPADSGQMDPLQQSVLSLLLEIVSSGTEKPPIPGKSADSRVLEAAAYMHEHFRENISLQEVAEAIRISPAYLARIFKECTGYTVNQYIIHCKIGYAQKLLTYEPKYTMKEISEQSGFSSVQYFYANFRRHTLCTPIEYQNRYAERLPEE